MRTPRTIKRTWPQCGRWAAVACLLLITISWPSPALAATPAWWDCAYGYRKQITVNAGSAAVPTAYTMSLTFNHASLASGGKSQADGDDIRVLYWNGSAWAQLDRFLDPGSSWNNSTTKIWFKTQAAIAASGSNGNYYLYYGNDSATNPPALPGNIFFFFDGFESGNFSAWDGGVGDAGPGDSITIDSSTVHTGTNAAKAYVDGAPVPPDTGGSYARVMKTFAGQSGLHATTWVYIPSTYSETDDVTVIQFYTGGWGAKIASLAIRGSDGSNTRKPLLGIWPENVGWFFGSPALTTGAWHRLEQKVIVSSTSGRVEVWQDGVKSIDLSNRNTGTGNIDFTLFAIFWKSANTGPETIYVDNTFMRLWVDPEPSIALGSELAQDCTPPSGFNACNYQYRQKITVTAGSSAVPSGYSVLLTFNHASLVSAGKSQADGDDIRIIYGSGGVELDRFLDPGASWNNSATKIWFKTQAAIPASGSDSSYYLYYGNTGATSPPANPSNIFFFYDGYESGSYSAWGAATAGPGDSNTVVTSPVKTGTYSARAYVDGEAGAGSYARVERSFTGQSAFHISQWVYVPSGYTATNDITTIHMYTGGWTTKVASLAIRAPIGDMRPLLGIWTESPVGWFFGSPALTTGAWHRLEMKVIVSPTAGRVEVWQDGVRSVNLSNRNTGTGTIDFTLENIFWKSAGTGPETMHFDDSIHRVWVDPEPTVTLSAEETVGAHGSYFTPDAAAAGMNVPVTFVGDICVVPTITTSSSDIVMGPKIVTDANGNVVTQNGRIMSTVFFVKPDARPGTAITVYADGQPLAHTFNIVIPSPDPNAGGSLSGRTKRGTKVLGGLTVPSGTLTIDTSDTDAGTAGNQGFLPAVILVKGDVNIAGTLDVKGQNGTNGAAGSGGAGGAGGPGGGGGAGGGVKQDGAAAAGGAGFSGGGGGGSKGTPGGVQIALDGTPSSATTTNDTLTFSHTIGGGSNRLIVLCIAIEGPSGSYDVTGSPTYNGVAMTKAVDRTVGGAGTNMNTEIWYMLNANLPAAGPYTVSITSTGSGDINAGAVSVTGAKQQASEATASSDDGGSSATSISTNITTSTNGAWIFDCVGSGNPVNFTENSGQAKRFEADGASSTVASSTETKATAGSETLGWTTSGSNRLSHVLAAFAPFGGVGASGGAGGDGTGGAGIASSGTNGGAGGIALSGASGGGGGVADTSLAGGAGGGGGTGNPFGTGGSGGQDNGGLAGQGGGGGGASGGGPGGGGGGGFATAGTRGPDDPDAGYGGNATGIAQLVPLAGGSGGAGGGPDVDITSVHTAGGGGGGGGAVLIYATGSVTVSGTITAAGGNGGNGYTSGADGSGGGGGGSGGAIFLQSSQVAASGTLTTLGGTAGTSGSTNGAGGAGGTGRIRIDGLATGVNISTIAGTAGSRHIGPVIDSLVDTTVKGRADGGSTVTLYVYDQTGTQVTGSPYTTSAGGSSGSVGTWTITNVTFPSGTGYLAVKQTTGSAQVLGPGRATKGLHLINWREVY